MTKQLLIMRHAKSSWSDGAATDHQRGLNKRGLRDAPRMAQFIAAQELTPDWIASSTARRARMTADIFAENCDGFEESNIQYLDEFYHAPPSAYLDFLTGITNNQNGDLETIMVVGHNPGMEKLVFRLAGHYETMPTAAIAHFQFEIDAWSEIEGAEATFQSVWRPKEIDW